jgi:hypothetical protein
MVDLEDEGKTVTGRNDVVYWFSMMLALWMNYEVAMSCLEFIEGSRDVLNDLPQEDQRVKGGHQQVPNTGRSTTTVESTPAEPVKTDRAPENCTVDAMYNEYFLAFQFYYKSCHDFLSQYYNTIWVLRWVVFAVFSIIWYKFPRTLYILFFVLNVAMIFITLKIKKSFRWPLAWTLILVEEVLVTLWHLAALINFVDYYGNRGMGQFLVNVNTHVMFWAYVFTVLIELILLVGGALVNKGYFSAFPETVAQSEDVKIEIQSQDELEGKIDTYRTMKESRVAPEVSKKGEDSELPTLNGLKD